MKNLPTVAILDATCNQICHLCRYLNLLFSRVLSHLLTQTEAVVANTNTRMQQPVVPIGDAIVINSQWFLPINSFSYPPVSSSIYKATKLTAR